MSSIGGIAGNVNPNYQAALSRMKAPTSPVAAPVKDADGDFDGTKVGQMDPRDFGKGTLIDRRG